MQIRVPLIAFKGLLISLIGTVLTAACLSDVQAQVTVGQISGTVTDQAGAAVPGVTLTVTNEATNATRTLTTDDNG